MKLVAPDIIFLELNYREMDGVELCFRIRDDSLNQNSFIIFYTTKIGNFAHIACLNAGADDYITKDISRPLLKSKLNAWMRRVNLGKRNYTEIVKRKIEVNSDRFSVYINNDEIALTKTEFKIISLLVSNSTKIFSREEIKKYVWKNNSNVKERTVDVHIRQLRIKIGVETISTLKGVGYSISLK